MGPRLRGDDRRETRDDDGVCGRAAGGSSAWHRPLPTRIGPCAYAALFVIWVSPRNSGDRPQSGWRQLVLDGRRAKLYISDRICPSDFASAGNVGARPCPDRRRRPHRACARGRSRLARRVVRADREDRRRGRASEDGSHRRAHDGVLPALGHRRLGARRALSRRLSAGLCLAHVAQRLRARARAVSRARLRARVRRRARRSASACRRTCSIRSSSGSRPRSTTSICRTIPSSSRSRRCPTTCAPPCATWRAGRRAPSRPTT